MGGLKNVWLIHKDDIDKIVKHLEEAIEILDSEGELRDLAARAVIRRAIKCLIEPDEE